MQALSIHIMCHKKLYGAYRTSSSTVITLNIRLLIARGVWRDPGVIDQIPLWFVSGSQNQKIV